MSRFLKVVAVLLIIAAVLVALHRPLLTAAAGWLIVDDPLERADVIVVLAGGAGAERVRQAADLYHQGYAPRVLLSGGETTLGIPETEILRRQALAHSIPDSALLFEPASTSTYEQARDLRPQLERLGARRAIVVTSSYHTRRTRYLFRKVFSGSPVEIRVFPVQRDIFNPDQWWTREWDTERVALEYIKLVLALFR
jgi:uncharacterized SAM-binding protein YcdF (DUF218 family)